jgi:hypothetical protein
MFMILAPWHQMLLNFFLRHWRLGQNKMERLSLQSLSSLIEYLLVRKEATQERRPSTKEGSGLICTYLIRLKIVANSVGDEEKKFYKFLQIFTNFLLHH